MKTKHAGLIGLVALGALAFVGALQNRAGSRFTRAIWAGGDRAEGDTAMEIAA